MRFSVKDYVIVDDDEEEVAMLTVRRTNKFKNDINVVAPVGHLSNLIAWTQ